jgi:hypothetical protein
VTTSPKYAWLCLSFRAPLYIRRQRMPTRYISALP